MIKNYYFNKVLNEVNNNEYFFIQKIISGNHNLTNQFFIIYYSVCALKLGLLKDESEEKKILLKALIQNKKAKVFKNF
jgi:hypothetical protein